MEGRSCKAQIELSIERQDRDSGSPVSGVGLRVRASRKFGLDYATDCARNVDQEDFLYDTLGQQL
ncbi:hypothetical protein [Aestuariivita boseongensis]|uniref:hypothetical protein n=1 Tax=Aestuariivita boseongensis TaxID=1470562 RepID=UPI000680B0C8|nr:hypothetical protein [Aestuariivita boseongensis]